MKLLVLQHVLFEGPAAIRSWANNNSHSIERLFTPEATEFPALDSFDCLIIMGGPMSVNDDLPWINAELDFIQQCIGRQHYVIGICLGAQLIAKAMGAAVLQNPVREIGWLPVTTNSQPKVTSHWANDLLPNSFTPLHWHGDTFTLPEQAQLLLSSQGCTNQAFSLNDRVLGLQFHLEFDIATASRVAAACADELAEGGLYVQEAKAILNEVEKFDTANQLLFDLLDGLAKHYNDEQQTVISS